MFKFMFKLTQLRRSIRPSHECNLGFINIVSTHKKIAELILIRMKINIIGVFILDHTAGGLRS